LRWILASCDFTNVPGNLLVYDVEISRWNIVHRGLFIRVFMRIFSFEFNITTSIDNSLLDTFEFNKANNKYDVDYGAKTTILTKISRYPDIKNMIFFAKYEYHDFVILCLKPMTKDLRFIHGQIIIMYLFKDISSKLDEIEKQDENKDFETIN